MNIFLEKFKSRVKQIDSIPIVPDTQVESFIEERWTVYKFTVPIKFSEKIAFGFPSKEIAKKFISDHLKPKTIDIGDMEYHVRYDVILESREEINVFYNDPEMTTVGNNRETILSNWLD